MELPKFAKAGLTVFGSIVGIGATGFLAYRAGVRDGQNTRRAEHINEYNRGLLDGTKEGLFLSPKQVPEERPRPQLVVSHL